MTAIEIILIIIGFICLCVSCFVAKKNSSYAAVSYTHLTLPTTERV